MSTPIKLIVGLGNPGPEYQGTRHNAGFWFVDEVLRAGLGQWQSESKFFGEAARISLHGHDVRLLKPSTFMNRSGQAVAALANFYKIPVESILVAHDELDFEPGVTRLKSGGGHGGHNGLRDIIAQMANQKTFKRLRIGIGHPGNAKQVSNYVLSKASPSDQIAIEASFMPVMSVLPLIIAGEFQKAMHQLHSDAAPAKE